MEQIIEMDGRQNGRVGICQLLVSTGLSNDLEEAVKAIMAGRVLLQGSGMNDPTVYPRLSVESRLTVMRGETELWTDEVVLKLIPPYRVFIEE